MNELRPAEFENKSLLNQQQSYTVAKIASYFRIPRKALTAAIDAEALEQGVVCFPDLADMFDERVLVLKDQFKAADLLNPRKFLTSDLCGNLTLALETDARVILFQHKTNNPYAVLPYREVGDLEGVGGLYINYRNFGEYVFLAFSEYLRARYPSPQE